MSLAEKSALLKAHLDHLYTIEVLVTFESHIVPLLDAQAATPTVLRHVGPRP